jgi:hypothetical protein
MENRKLEIADEYLNDVLKHAAVKLVGEIMSNMETISNPEELKSTVKNTVYQNFRDLNGQIHAFDCGVKFVRPLPVKK